MLDPSIKVIPGGNEHHRPRNIKSLQDMNTTVHEISNPCRIWTPPSTGYKIPAGYEHLRPRDIKSLQDMNTSVQGISNPCRIWTPPSTGYKIPPGYEPLRPRDIKSLQDMNTSVQGISNPSRIWTPPSTGYQIGIKWIRRSAKIGDQCSDFDIYNTSSDLWISMSLQST